MLDGELASLLSFLDAVKADAVVSSCHDLLAIGGEYDLIGLDIFLHVQPPDFLAGGDVDEADALRIRTHSEDLPIR